MHRAGRARLPGRPLDVRLSVRLPGRPETRIPPGSRLAAPRRFHNWRRARPKRRVAGAATCRADSSRGSANAKGEASAEADASSRAGARRPHRRRRTAFLSFPRTLGNSKNPSGRRTRVIQGILGPRFRGDDPFALDSPGRRGADPHPAGLASGRSRNWGRARPERQV